jgi:hypothetical protein
MLNRRKFFRGVAGLLAAPAIVRVGSIMPVRAFLPEWSEASSVTFVSPPTPVMVRDLLLPGLNPDYDFDTDALLIADGPQYSIAYEKFRSVFAPQ